MKKVVCRVTTKQYNWYVDVACANIKVNKRRFIKVAFNGIPLTSEKPPKEYKIIDLRQLGKNLLKWRKEIKK